MSVESIPTLSSAMSQVFEVLLSEQLHTCLPAIIIEYDATERKATVQPQIKLQYLDETVLEYQPITEVPVISFEAGNAGLKLPSAQYINQTCLLVFCERSMDTWLLKDGADKPSDPRKFDITDAVAIVGMNKFTNKGTDNNDLELKYNGTDITIKENGDIELNGGNKVIIKANGDIELGESALKAIMTDDIITKYNAHVHTGVTTGTGASGPIAPASPNLFNSGDATQKVKAQ